MGVVTKLVFYIIPIVVLVLLIIFFYSDAGAFEKVKRAASTAEQYLPDISVGAKEITAEKPSIPENQQQAIVAFKEALLRTKESSRVNCFTKFGGFPPLGEEGATLVISHILSDEVTSVRVTGTKQTLTDLSFEVPGMIPCVIGGGTEYTEKFYQNYLSPSLMADDSFTPISNDGISEISIQWNSGGVLETAANRIQYDATGFHDFKGQRWLYKPDAQHICFFPTDSSTSAIGLDDYYFKDFENPPEDTLQYKVRNGPLKQC